MKTFDLFGEVGWEITLKGVRDFTKNNKEDSTFNISTLGGDINHGLSIHDTIKSMQGDTVGKIVGMTASAGTVIALACETTQISENALFLIHNAWTDLSGNSSQLRKKADELDSIDNRLIKIYKTKSDSNKKDKSEEEIRELMAQEEWLTPDEAMEWGFVDEIIPAESAIAANYKLLNRDLETKLKEKMNIFKNKKENSKAYILNLKEGQILASAETIEAGVEVAPLGETELEDGDVELADGRIITIKDGKIEAVKDAEEEEEEVEAASNEELLNSVSELMAESNAKFEERFAKIEASLKGISSNGKPPKGSVNNESTVKNNKAAISNVRAKLKEKRDKFLEERNK